jgi:putative ABC transport system permease protein
VIIGDLLAEKLQTGPGKVITLASDIFPGDWSFTVVGLYKPAYDTVDRSSVVLRWDYLNDDTRAADTREHVGWIVTTVSDPQRGPEISRAIDARFDTKEDPTLTSSARALHLQWLGAFGAVLTALDYASMIILAIMILILANTL